MQQVRTHQTTPLLASLLFWPDNQTGSLPSLAAAEDEELCVNALDAQPKVQTIARSRSIAVMNFLNHVYLRAIKITGPR